MTTSEFPLIISVDDHVVEPADLWWDRLGPKDRERGPQVVRRRGRMEGGYPPRFVDDDSTDSRWTDVWTYGDYEWPMIAAFAYVGPPRDKSQPGTELVTYEDILPGCFDRDLRLADMARNGVEASLCFPTVPRFCGQLFLKAQDKELALRCLRIYNDWMIDEWCGGPAYGKLIPLTVVPLWDQKLAEEEVIRCAEKGSHAIAFPEAMHPLGLDTLYSGKWERFLDACSETRTVVNMHIGSSSQIPQTSPDAPFEVAVALNHENAAHTLVDWVFSGVLVRHPELAVVLSEGQAGWIPYMLQRLDDLWDRSTDYNPELRDRVPERPSTLVRGKIHSCIFNDPLGLKARNELGMEHLMFETDYPHMDSSFPDSAITAKKLVQEAEMSDSEVWQFLRGNAIRVYGLERYGYNETTPEG